MARDTLSDITAFVAVARERGFTKMDVSMRCPEDGKKHPPTQMVKVSPRPLADDLSRWAAFSHRWRCVAGGTPRTT